MSSSFILAPQWIFTAEPNVGDPNGQLLENYAIAVVDGHIAELAPVSEVVSNNPALTLIERPMQIVIPGLINAHCHMAMSLMRGLADDLPLHTWLQEHIWPAEGANVSPEFVELGTRHAAAEMLLGGTTCVNDMYFFAESSANVLDELGMRATLGMITIDFPSAMADGPSGYIERGMALYEQVKDKPLLSVAWAPHAPYTVCDESFKQVRELSEEMDVQLHTHLHETPQELTDSVEAHGVRPIQRLYELGILSDRTIAVHMTHLDNSEIELCKQLSISIVHCPESNLKLASGMAPVHRLVQAGINVAIGTDGAASNNDLDMFSEIRTASLLAKGLSGDPTALPAAVVLQMATLNGARALGIEETTGSIAVGKAADLCCINLDQVATQPIYDPISTVVYAATRSQVNDVWVAGQAKVTNGQLLNIDLDDLKVQVNKARDQVISSLAETK
jgi:5-methylthioadenosine/S-adenosylhomocysteine deaminase